MKKIILPSAIAIAFVLFSPVPSKATMLKGLEKTMISALALDSDSTNENINSSSVVKSFDFIRAIVVFVSIASALACANDLK